MNDENWKLWYRALRAANPEAYRPPAPLEPRGMSWAGKGAND